MQVSTAARRRRRLALELDGSPRFEVALTAAGVSGAGERNFRRAFREEAELGEVVDGLGLLRVLCVLRKDQVGVKRAAVDKVTHACCERRLARGNPLAPSEAWAWRRLRQLIPFFVLADILIGRLSPNAEERKRSQRRSRRSGLDGRRAWCQSEPSFDGQERCILDRG